MRYDFVEVSVLNASAFHPDHLAVFDPHLKIYIKKNQICQKKNYLIEKQRQIINTPQKHPKNF